MRTGDAGDTVLVTAFGVVAAATMVTAYAFESRSRVWIAVFAGACLAVAVYGSITGAWIFATLEVVWAGIAIQRFRSHPDAPEPAT